MRDILKLARIQLICIVLFIFFKFIRKPVLKSDAPNFFKTILLSLPNFFEAVIGTMTVTAILLILNNRWLPKNRQINRKRIYDMAVILAGIYVITQELKVHNLGGNNVFDPNDVVFSCIGLLIGYMIIIRIKPQIYGD